MMAKEFYAHSIDGKPVDDWHRLEEHLKGTARGDCPRFTDGVKRSPLTCHCETRSAEAISAVRDSLRIGTVPG